MLPGAAAVTLRRWYVGRNRDRTPTAVALEAAMAPPLSEHGYGPAEGISIRLTNSVQSGDRSSKSSVTMVDRSGGSLSIDQANASLLRRNSAMSTPQQSHRRTGGQRWHARRSSFVTHRSSRGPRPKS